MPVTAEAASLLGQIRDIRSRRLERYQDDLHSIDRAYDDEIANIRRSGWRRGSVQLLLMATAPAAGVALAALVNVLWRL